MHRKLKKIIVLVTIFVFAAAGCQKSDSTISRPQAGDAQARETTGTQTQSETAAASKATVAKTTTSPAQSKIETTAAAAAETRSADGTEDQPDDLAKIVYFDLMPTPDRSEALAKLVSEYNASGQGLCEYESAPRDEAFIRIMTLAASNEMPEVVSIDGQTMAALASGEYIEPLDMWFDFHYPYKDKLSQAFLKCSSGWTYKGIRYMIPDSYGCRCIFIRSDWLAEAGIDVESLRCWSWDQYFDVIKKLTNNDKDRYGIAFCGGFNGVSLFYEYACSMLEAGGCFPENSGVSIFERPEIVELLKGYYGLYIDGCAPEESIGWDFKEMAEGFISGRCATLYHTPDIVPAIRESMPDGVWDALPCPVNRDASTNYINWSDASGFAIGVSDENFQAAWDFVVFMLAPERNREYATEIGCLPIYSDTLQDETYQSGAFKGLADALSNPGNRLLKTGEILEWDFFLTRYAYAEIHNFVDGKQSAEAAVVALAEWLNREYEVER